MPTPSGLLKKGDRLRHKPTGFTFTVLERHGNDAGFAIVLRGDTEEARAKIGVSSRGYGNAPGTFTLLEAGYWTRPNNGEYELIDDDALLLQNRSEDDTVVTDAIAASLTDEVLGQRLRMIAAGDRGINRAQRGSYLREAARRLEGSKQ